jgi:predicted HAD superfamily Cof-like phosphohydrolase
MQMTKMVREFQVDKLKREPRSCLGFTDSEKMFFVNALYEEADELKDSSLIVTDVDALLDSIYFALGGLIALGLSDLQVEKCFQAVHEANMKKQSGSKPQRLTDEPDVIKPVTWVDPIHKINNILFGDNNV